MAQEKGNHQYKCCFYRTSVNPNLKAIFFTTVHVLFFLYYLSSLGSFNTQNKESNIANMFHDVQMCPMIMKRTLITHFSIACVSTLILIIE